MRAAVLEEFRRPLVLREVPDPIAGPGEVLVRVRAVGLCGTDIKITSGVIPGLELPRIPGHEVAGEVLAAGDGFAAGDRVAVYGLDSCGMCAACCRGDTEVCDEAVRIGFERDGGLAELLPVKAKHLIPFGEEISFEQAAVTMDAVLSSYRSLRRRANVGPGDTVLIVGAGGLGLHGVQAALAAGSRVAVVDPIASHRERALQLGAELAVTPEELGAGVIGEFAPDGVDVALEVSGSPDGFRAGAEALRPGGLIIVSGYRPGSDYGLSSFRLALGQLRIEGNRGGRVEHAREALAAVERGEIEPLIDHVEPFDAVNELLDELRAGEVLGRVVVSLP
jgi:D-arabinose 1-dehydrogenase-like Zn-dependent alcohol dehydrogenase